MEIKIRLKDLYLIAVITIGLIGLGVGSSFAMFTASATIDNPIAFNSNLSSTNLLSETVEVVVPAGDDKSVDLVISNVNANSLNYSTWYSPSSNDLEVGSESSSNSYGPSGTLPSAGNFTLTVQLRNNGSSPITVTIGVSSSTTNIVLPSGVTEVPSTQLSNFFTLSDFTYVLGSDQTTISSLSADFYNQSTQTISEQNNVTLPGTINISSNEVLLVRYIGTDTDVSIPDSVTINGNTYNVAILSYATDGSNLRTGLFFRNTNIENVTIDSDVNIIALNSSDNGFVSDYARGLFTGCTSLETVSELPSTITNMYYTFSECASLESVPDLPSSVTNISSVFSGCTNLSSINLSNIDLGDVTEYVDAFSGVSTTSTITVPDCTQYRLFVSKFGSSYTGLTATSSDYTCYYQQVEFIQSSGTQYIDTGIKSSSNTKTEVRFKANAWAGAVFGNYSENGVIASSNTLYIGTQQQGYFYSTDYGAQSNRTTLGTANLTDYFVAVVDLKNRKVSLNGTETSRVSSTTWQGANNQILFARTYTTSDAGYFSKINLSYCKIWENDVLVRYFIPCYSLITVTNSAGVQCASGTIGLYDTVNDVFYTNNGTGTFVKGQDVNS